MILGSASPGLYPSARFPRRILIGRSYDKRNQAERFSERDRQRADAGSMVGAGRFPRRRRTILSADQDALSDLSQYYGQRGASKPSLSAGDHTFEDIRGDNRNP